VLVTHDASLAARCSRQLKLVSAGCLSAARAAICHGSIPTVTSTHRNFVSQPIRLLRASSVSKLLSKVVAHCVIPAVERTNWDTVRNWPMRAVTVTAWAFTRLYVEQAQSDDLQALETLLQTHVADPRLVAVGEIGLDYFVPELQQGPLKERQELFYREQLKLARHFQLPVVLHVRRSADRLLKHLRELGRAGHRWSGIAHAFNGSDTQAQRFYRTGFQARFWWCLDL
jgi:Tat protein secretion system quality control protein TatD with DNase activity